MGESFFAALPFGGTPRSGTCSRSATSRSKPRRREIPRRYRSPEPGELQISRWARTGREGFELGMASHSSRGSKANSGQLWHGHVVYPVRLLFRSQGVGQTNGASRGEWRKRANRIDHRECSQVHHGGFALDNDPILRRSLRNALDGSNPTGPADDRKERFGLRTCNGGVCVDSLYSADATNSTACSNHPPIPLPPGTVATWHTHPFIPGSQGGDPTPRSGALCPRDEPLRSGGTGYSRAFPSPSDFNRVGENGVKTYIVDRSNIYVIYPVSFPPGTDPDVIIAALRAGTRTVPRTSNCDPLKY